MEHIVDTFANGLKNMRQNTVLFAPFFIFFIAVFVLTLALIAGLMIVLTVLADSASLIPAFAVVLLIYVIVLILFSCSFVLYDSRNRRHVQRSDCCRHDETRRRVDLRQQIHASDFGIKHFAFYS